MKTRRDFFTLVTAALSTFFFKLTNPIVTTSSKLSPALQAYLTKRSLETLRTNFVFKSICEPTPIPKVSGNTITWFRRTQ